MCVWGGGGGGGAGGGGAGYVKIVMTGMSGPNFFIKTGIKTTPVRIICFKINSKFISVNSIHCKLIY